LINLHSTTIVTRAAVREGVGFETDVSIVAAHLNSAAITFSTEVREGTRLDADVSIVMNKIHSASNIRAAVREGT
jgi:hypothetical protein